MGKLPGLMLAGLSLAIAHVAALAQDTDEVSPTAVSEQQTSAHQWLEAAGQIDLEAVFMRPATGEDSEGIGIAEAVLGISAKFESGISAELRLLHEKTDIGAPEDEEGAKATILEVAMLSFQPGKGPWSFEAGRNFLPFGVFYTRMITDPLTLDLAETNEVGAYVGYASNGFSGTVFGFNGDDGDEGGLAGFGASLAYSHAGGPMALDLNLAYTSDFSYSDSLLVLRSATQEISRRTPGLAANARLSYGSGTLILEHISALERFPREQIGFLGLGARPSSWMIEAAYEFPLVGKAASIALGYQGTNESPALELPKRRWLAALDLKLVEPVLLAVEWARDEDYPIAEGGSGEEFTVVTLQFSVFF